MTSHTLPMPAAPVANDPERRTWMIATSAVGGVAAVATAVPFVSSFAPSERARAMGAAVEVEIGDIPPGGMKTVEWRGKPVWIVRRSPEMLAALKSPSPDLVDPNSVRDQQPDYARNATRSVRAGGVRRGGHLHPPGLLAHGGAGRFGQPEPAGATGKAATSAPATAPPSTAPGGCSRTSPRRQTWRSRRTSSSATRAC